MKASCGMDTLPMFFIRFLPSFCFSSQLTFAGNITAVALCRHILAKGTNRLTGNDLRAHARLNGDF